MMEEREWPGPAGGAPRSGATVEAIKGKTTIPASIRTSETRWLYNSAPATPAQRLSKAPRTAAPPKTGDGRRAHILETLAVRPENVANDQGIQEYRVILVGPPIVAEEAFSEHGCVGAKRRATQTATAPPDMLWGTGRSPYRTSWDFQQKKVILTGETRLLTSRTQRSRSAELESHAASW